MEPLSPGPLEAGRAALLARTGGRRVGTSRRRSARPRRPKRSSGSASRNEPSSTGSRLSPPTSGDTCWRGTREPRLAARLALELAIDSSTFRGPAETRGWLDRAGRLLEGLPPGEEHGIHAYLRGALRSTSSTILRRPGGWPPRVSQSPRPEDRWTARWCVCRSKAWPSWRRVRWTKGCGGWTRRRLRRWQTRRPTRASWRSSAAI